MDYWLEQRSLQPRARNFARLHGDAELETPAVINGDGSVMIMVANLAVYAASDNNGPGAPRGVQVDVSGLDIFPSGSWLVIDKSTSVASGLWRPW